MLLSYALPSPALFPSSAHRFSAPLLPFRPSATPYSALPFSAPLLPFPPLPFPPLHFPSLPFPPSVLPLLLLLSSDVVRTLTPSNRLQWSNCFGWYEFVLPILFCMRRPPALFFRIVGEDLRRRSLQSAGHQPPVQQTTIQTIHQLSSWLFMKRHHLTTKHHNCAWRPAEGSVQQSDRRRLRERGSNPANSSWQRER